MSKLAADSWTLWARSRVRRQVPAGKVPAEKLLLSIERLLKAKLARCGCIGLLKARLGHRPNCWCELVFN